MITCMYGPAMTDHLPPSRFFEITIDDGAVTLTPTAAYEPPNRPTIMGPKPVPTHVRIMSNIRVAANGCWEWTGRIAPNDGYGRIHVGSKADGTAARRVPHRVLWELLYGPVDSALDLDHTCHNEDLTCAGGVTCLHRRCVNPAHLTPSSRRENLLGGRGFAATRHAQTHCIHGHEYTAANTIVNPKNGGRRCRTCANIQRAKYPHYRGKSGKASVRAADAVEALL